MLLEEGEHPRPRFFVDDQLVLDARVGQGLLEGGILLGGDVLVVTRLEREDGCFELAARCVGPGAPSRSPGMP